MGDPTGLSSVLAGKALDATIGYVKTANRYNAQHKELEDLVHTTGAFLQACPSGIARPIVQRVFQDVQPLHTGAQVLVRKRQDWEDKTTTFDRQLRLHTRWKLSKDALDHTQKIRMTEADRLPRAILVSVLDLQKELKSLRQDVREIKSSLGHSGASKQGTNSQETKTPKQEKRKQKRRKQKTSKQEKDNEAAAGKGMDAARADCVTHFSRGVRNIQERLTDSIMEGGHDALSDVIEGAMQDVVNLHMESIRSAQNTQLCSSSTVTSESWDSTIIRKSFGDGRDLTNAVPPESTGETEHLEAEETELAEDVGIENEQFQGPTVSQYISREISYGKTGNFTFEALMTATDNFANLLGEGGSALVYRGCLPDGSRVAVKCYSARGESAFWREVRCSLEHPALVKILGWCAPTPAFTTSRWQRSFFSKKKKEKLLSENREKQCLVMEYLEGGSLDDHLYGDNVRSLEWPVRLKICIGVAGGISFLHKQGIIHRDIKPSNILFDENLSPKISDFGIISLLSESLSGTTSNIRSTEATEILDHTRTTGLAGTVGYLDPMYCTTSKVSLKTDVYSFGATLLNVLSGSRAVIFEDGGRRELLLERARTLFKENNVRELIDPKMERTIEDVTDVKEVVRIALLCCERNREDRPTIDEVHSMLVKVSSKC